MYFFSMLNSGEILNRTILNGNISNNNYNYTKNMTVLEGRDDGGDSVIYNYSLNLITTHNIIDYNNDTAARER